MDVSNVGFMLAVCLVILDFSYADRMVQVTDDVCNRTYTLNQNERIILSFKPDNPFYAYAHTFTSCVFTIINHDTISRQTCISNHGKDAVLHSQMDTCSKVLKYFIGYLPFHLKNGYSCYDFKRTPKCTSQSTVYVLIENARAIAMYPVSVALYVKERVVPTTRRVTTTYRYNNDGDDYDDHYNQSDSGIGNLIKGVIGAAVLVILFYVCVTYLKSKLSRNTGVTNDNQQSPSMPTYLPDTDSPGMPIHSDEAPPYSEVMQHQQLYSYEEEKQGYIHHPVDQTARPTAATTFTIPENQSLCQDHPVTSDRSDEQAGNQITPTAPPLDYADRPPPPPYPGY